MSRVLPPEEAVTIELDGRRLIARDGEPVAAALIAAGELVFARSPKYHRPRGPFCLSGGCSHCLMRVDGVPNVPTCRVKVREGMRLERQNALPGGQVDLLRATDFVFRQWFNHHEFLTGLPIAERVLVRVARQLSGLGLLPATAPPERPKASYQAEGTVIIGAGPAGLAVARHLEEAGYPFRLLEREDEAGGRLLWGAEDEGSVPWSPPPSRVRLGALVVGLFADDGPPFLAALEGGRLHLVHYRRLVLAHGGHPILPTFPNNDLPGVMAGRAVSALVRRHRVLPGRTIACVGEPNEARALARLVQRAGATAVAVGHQVLRAHGLKRVEGVTARNGQETSRYPCDVIASCGPVGPAFELARAAGATVLWDGEARLFAVEADEHGRTAAPGVWVAGELRGPMSSLEAAAQGARVGQAIVAGGER